MKKVVALLLTLSMLISANTFVFADSAETGNSTESYQQQDNSENQIVTYLSQQERQRLKTFYLFYLVFTIKQFLPI